MALDEWYAQNQGKSLLVPGEPESERGQCVQAVDFVLKEVYSQPFHYGNAIDWWRNPGELLNNFERTNDPIKKGDFVIFDERVGSVYGHIDVAAQDGNPGGFLGYDSNWGGNKTVHTVQHSNQFILGQLRLKGGDMTITTREEANIPYQLAFGRTATDAEAQNTIGKTLLQVGTELMATDPYKIVRAHDQFYDADVAAAAGGAQKKLDQIKQILN